MAPGEAFTEIRQATNIPKIVQRRGQGNAISGRVATAAGVPQDMPRLQHDTIVIIVSGNYVSQTSAPVSSRSASTRLKPSFEIDTESCFRTMMGGATTCG
jgi:hypothetical protein